MPTLGNHDDGVITGGVELDLTIPLTIGAGSNRLLVVATSWYVGSSTTVGVTYDGTPLDLGVRLGTWASGWDGELWYMVNPPTGTADVVVTWSQPPFGGAVASEWTGVNQATPIGDTDSAAEGSADQILSLTLTTTSGDTGVSGIGYWDNNTIPTKGASDNVIDTPTPVNEEVVCGSSYQNASGASVTMSWDPSAGAVTGPMTAMVLKDAAAGGGPAMNLVYRSIHTA